MSRRTDPWLPSWSRRPAWRGRALLTVMAVLVLPIGAVGCAEQEPDAPLDVETDLEPDNGEVGIPNPAAVHCEEQGGTLEVRDEPGGEVGYCLFDDGTECEEWAYFHGECTPGG